MASPPITSRIILLANKEVIPPLYELLSLTYLG
jgi:hypothetical protein